MDKHTTGGGTNICNAESDSFRALLNRKLSAFSQVHAAYQSGTKPFDKARCEIAASKIVLLRELLESLPSASASPSPVNLMGEKPTLLLSLDSEIEAFKLQRDESKAIAFNPETESFLRNQAFLNFGKAAAVLITLERLRSSPISGNAAEQPGPREESRPVTGKIPVTPGGANPSESCLKLTRWFSSMTESILDHEVSALSEILLDELERREVSPCWSSI